MTRRPSPAQRAILDHVRDNHTITLFRAVQIVGNYDYCYATEHKRVCKILSNMVKRGLLVRVKPGVFAMSKTHTAPTMVDKQ